MGPLDGLVPDPQDNAGRHPAKRRDERWYRATNLIELTPETDNFEGDRGEVTEMIFGRTGFDRIVNESPLADLYFLGGPDGDLYKVRPGTTTTIHETGDGEIDNFLFVLDPDAATDLKSTTIDAGDRQHLLLEDAATDTSVLFVDWMNPNSRIEVFAFETPTASGDFELFEQTYDQFRSAALDETPDTGNPRDPDYQGMINISEFGTPQEVEQLLNAIEIADDIDFGPRDAKTVAYFYEVSFGRTPDVEGMNFWIDQRENYAASFGEEGLTEKQVAEFFLNSDEFAENVGDPNSLSDREFTEELYGNFLGREADNAGLDFWTGLVEADNGFDRVDLLVEFATSDELRTKTPAPGFQPIETLFDYNPGIQIQLPDLAGPMEDWDF